MQKGEKDIVMSGGNTNKAGVGNSIDVLEHRLQLAIVENTPRKYHYDELIYHDRTGFVHNRVKPVRDEYGRVDVFQTFMIARKRNGGL